MSFSSLLQCTAQDRLNSLGSRRNVKGISFPDAGDFAETIRNQFLAERLEYFKELQRVLYVEAMNEESATKEQLVKSLCRVDPDLGEKQVLYITMSLSTQVLLFLFC